MNNNIQTILASWNQETKKVAQDFISKYGNPDEATNSMLIWHNNGPWKKTVVTDKATNHVFPMPHTDIVEQFIPYKVPEDKVSDIVSYDGSVTVKRTEGLLSARCHDEEANFLALNLTHDIIKGNLDVNKAKDKYLQNLIDFRKGKKTPYMEKLQFEISERGEDPGRQMIDKEKLESYRND